MNFFAVIAVLRSNLLCRFCFYFARPMRMPKRRELDFEF